MARTPRVGFAVVLLVAASLSGCAGRQAPRPDYDPWEPLNRKIFWFNDTLDTYALEPVARGWDRVMPDPVQRGLANFFLNLRFPIVFANDLLQGKPRAAAAALARFEINTLFGALGFVDLATDLGLPVQEEDTGQTFGVWGISPGPYLVLPLFGPSNPRDTVGLAGDSALGFFTYFIPVPYATLGASAIDILNQRSRLLDEVANAKDAALDYYVFVRNAYVQRRWKLVNDALSRPSPHDERTYDEENYADVSGGAPAEPDPQAASGGGGCVARPATQGPIVGAGRTATNQSRHTPGSAHLHAH